VSLDLSFLDRIPLLGWSTKGDTLLNETHLSSESGVRNPGPRVTRRHFFQHSIDLLEGKPLRLRDQKVREENADDAEGAPHEEDLGGEVSVLFIDQVWRDDGDNTIPEPVAGS